MVPPLPLPGLGGQAGAAGLVAVLVGHGPISRAMVGNALPAGRAVPAEHWQVGVPGQQGGGPGGVVEGHLGQGARPLSRDRAQAEQRTDRSPRLPGLAGPADTGAHLGVHRQLEFTGDPDRLSRRGLWRGQNDDVRDGGLGGTQTKLRSLRQKR